MNLVTKEKEEENNLFMMKHSSEVIAETIWLVDSGCSNHMSGVKELFRDIDNTHTLIVRLGDNKEINVEGKGIVMLDTFERQNFFTMCSLFLV